MDELVSLMANEVLGGEMPAGWMWNEEGTELYMTLTAPQAERLRRALREWIDSPLHVANREAAERHWLRPPPETNDWRP